MKKEDPVLDPEFEAEIIANNLNNTYLVFISTNFSSEGDPNAELQRRLYRGQLEKYVTTNGIEVLNGDTSNGMILKPSGVHLLNLKEKEYVGHITKNEEDLFV